MQRSVPTFVALFANSSMHAAIIKPTKPENDSSYATEMRALVGLQAGNGAGPVELTVCAVGLICQ